MPDLSEIFLEQSDNFCKEISPPVLVERLSFHLRKGRRLFGLIECEGRYFQFFCDVTVFFMHEYDVDESFEEVYDDLSVETDHIYTNFRIEKIVKEDDLVLFYCDKFDLEIEVRDDRFFPRQPKWR